jgi:hypothetical protein
MRTTPQKNVTQATFNIDARRQRHAQLLFFDNSTRPREFCRARGPLRFTFNL